MKTTVGTKVDDELLERLKRVATVDRRTVSNVLELCILRGLPELEEDLERRQLLARTSTAAPESSPKPPQEAAARVLRAAIQRSKGARGS